MSSKLVKFCLFLTFLINTRAYAFSVARQSEVDLKSSEKQFLYVIGYSGTLGSTLIRSALTVSAKYKELYPRSYHLFVIAKDPQYEQEKLKRYPWQVTLTNDENLSAKKLIELARDHDKDFSAIHVFSHNSALAGVGLQKTERLTHADKELKKLSKVLTDDAYVFLHGCNTGWYEAPNMAAMLKVPVWGSFSGTDFEELYDVGEWFNHNQGNFPEGATVAEFNLLSYLTPKKCSQGHCIRMRPDNSTYSGTWGKYKVGLGFYKQFCPKSSESDCLSAYKKMLLAYPSYHNTHEAQSFDAYKENLIDFLCPSRTYKSTKYQECLDILKFTDLNPSVVSPGNSFKGTSLKCSPKDNTCYFQVVGCQSGVCSFEPTTASKVGLTELQKEYLHGLKAFIQQ